MILYQYGSKIKSSSENRQLAVYEMNGSSFILGWVRDYSVRNVTQPGSGDILDSYQIQS
jgi:hypothetical protein